MYLFHYGCALSFSGIGEKILKRGWLCCYDVWSLNKSCVDDIPVAGDDEFVISAKVLDIFLQSYGYMRTDCCHRASRQFV